MPNNVPASFEHAIQWARYGEYCFVGAAIVVTVMSIVPPFLLLRGLPTEYYILRVAFLLLGLSVCLSLAWITRVRLIKPLEQNRVPQRRWALFLWIMALPFGLLIGFIVLAYADEKIKNLA